MLSFADVGISEILDLLKTNGITITGLLKVWTTVQISPSDQQDLNHRAQQDGLAGLEVHVSRID